MDRITNFKVSERVSMVGIDAMFMSPQLPEVVRTNWYAITKVTIKTAAWCLIVYYSQSSNLGHELKLL